MLAATLAMPAGASDRWFTVEIIVFDDLREEGLHAEHWPGDPGEPFLGDAVALTHPRATGTDDADSAYQLVSPSELSLNAVRNTLQVDVDLLYSRPAGGGATAPGMAPARFRLVSERRMRSGELHYIDHPLFGVLILLTPV